MYILNSLLEKLINENQINEGNLHSFLYDFNYINAFLDYTKPNVLKFKGLRKVLVSSYDPEIESLRELTDKLLSEIPLDSLKHIQSAIYNANLYVTNETLPLIIKGERKSSKTLIDAFHKIVNQVYIYITNDLYKHSINNYIDEKGVSQLAIATYAMVTYRTAIMILHYFTDTEYSVNYMNNFPTLVEMAQRGWIYENNEVSNNGMTPIQKHTIEKKSIVFPLAEKIWSYDKNTNLLMRKQVAELVVELLPSLELRVPQVDKWLKDSFPVPQAIIDRCARNDYGNKKHETIEREKIKNKIYVELSSENSKYL